MSGRTAAGGAGRARTHGSPSLSRPPTLMMTQGDLQKTPCPCPWSCTCVWLRSWRGCPHCRTIRSSPPWSHLLLHLCFQILGEPVSYPKPVLPRRGDSGKCSSCLATMTVQTPPVFMSNLYSIVTKYCRGCLYFHLALLLNFGSFLEDRASEEEFIRSKNLNIVKTLTCCQFTQKHCTSGATRREHEKSSLTA